MEPVTAESASREHISSVTKELLRQACGATLPACVALDPTLLNPNLTKTQRQTMQIRAGALLVKIFRQKLWHEVLGHVAMEIPAVLEQVTKHVVAQIEKHYTLGLSLHCKTMISASETKWRTLFHALHYDMDNKRRTVNGVALPQLLHSWDALQKLVGVFRNASDEPRYLPCVPNNPSRYVDFGKQIQELLGSSTVRRELLHIEDPPPDTTVNVPLHLILGFDGKEMVRFGVAREHSLVHGSWTFLHGRMSRSPVLRHPAFVITGKDSDPTHMSSGTFWSGTHP
jgi:hypothetical protein